MASETNFIVAQLGARMHYAVPRILHNAEKLEMLYTDFSASQGWPRLLNFIPSLLRPAAVQRMLGRRADGIPTEKVAAFNSLGLRYGNKLRHSRTPRERTEAFLWSGKEFCRNVLHSGFRNANAVYTFNTAGMEILQVAHHRGMRCFSEQTIAPKQIEMELLEVERALYPNWEPDGGADSSATQLAEREFAEWNEADTILCACDFVRDSIARCGGPLEKCRVVPYGVDLFQGCLERQEIKAVKERPLRVLTVGAVGLRKGSPYVLEAAKKMGKDAEFRMVGPLGITPRAQTELRSHLDLTGPVPRTSISGQFAWADVFLLPSICEGSATVTYEALAHGLPVICTPNTGSVVRDNREGFIVPIRDVEGIVARLEQLAGNADLLGRMGHNASRRADEFTIAAYGRRLLAAVQ